MKKEPIKTPCPECDGQGGRMSDAHDFEPCDVCEGQGWWYS